MGYNFHYGDCATLRARVVPKWMGLEGRWGTEDGGTILCGVCDAGIENLYTVTCNIDWYALVQAAWKEEKA